MAKIAYHGYIYESLNEKELQYIHGKMQHAIEDFNAVLNTVHDGNQKKAMSSLMNKTLDTFNEKIKGTDYAPKSLEDMEKQANEIDSDLRDQSLVDDQSRAETASEQSNIVNEKYA